MFKQCRVNFICHKIQKQFNMFFSMFKSVGSDQLAYPRNLIRVLPVRMNELRTQNIYMYIYIVNNPINTPGMVFLFLKNTAIKKGNNQYVAYKLALFFMPPPFRNCGGGAHIVSPLSVRWSRIWVSVHCLLKRFIGFI